MQGLKIYFSLLTSILWNFTCTRKCSLPVSLLQVTNGYTLAGRCMNKKIVLKVNAYMGNAAPARVEENKVTFFKTVLIIYKYTGAELLYSCAQKVGAKYLVVQSLNEC